MNHRHTSITEFLWSMIAFGLICGGIIYTMLATTPEAAR